MTFSTSYIVWMLVSAIIGFLIAWLIRESKVKQMGSWGKEKESELNELKATHEKLLSKHKNLQSKHGDLKAINKKHDKTLASLEAKVHQLEEQLAQKNNLPTKAKVAVEKTSIDNNYEIRALKAAHTRFEKELHYKTEEIERLNNENEALATKVEVLNLTAEDALQQKESAYAQMEKYEQYKPRFEQANLERNSLKFKYEQLLAAQSNFSEDIEKWKLKCNTLEQESGKWKDKWDRASILIDSLQNKISVIENQQESQTRLFDNLQIKYDNILRLQERTEEKLKAFQAQK